MCNNYVEDQTSSEMSAPACGLTTNAIRRSGADLRVLEGPSNTVTGIGIHSGIVQNDEQ